jgi:hypothetical protein
VPRCEINLDEMKVFSTVETAGEGLPNRAHNIANSRGFMPKLISGQKPKEIQISAATIVIHEGRGGLSQFPEVHLTDLRSHISRKLRVEFVTGTEHKPFESTASWAPTALQRIVP